MHRCIRNKTQLIIAGLALLVSSQAMSQNASQEEITAEDIGKWIAEDNERRGYTGMELTQMISKVSYEQSSVLAIDVLVEQLNVAQAKAVDVGVISSSVQDRDAFLGSFVNTAGKCTMFHAAQRDSLVSRGSDGSFYDKKRAKMASSFVDFLEAIERITEYPELQESQVAIFNDSYEENIKDWWEMMRTAGVEDSAEQKSYMQWEKKCDRSAQEYDKVWEHARARLDTEAIEAEAIKRLTAE